MKNLESFGVRDLNAKELNKINGGLFGFDVPFIDNAIDSAISFTAGVISYFSGENSTSPYPKQGCVG
ncbi:hypothetical protein [Gaetbulibacter aestuarii]|uniref:Bacteriocin-type signal sequence n=1 Tax=Gaetbulibacter aestuarii TaxID=1502358 RepID=A0ABW7MUL7_9FLAO